MANSSVKKIRNRPELEPGEEVIDACFGFGKGVLKLADLASPGRPFTRGADEVLADPAGSEGAKIDRSGILALTDRRLLFFPVKTAVTKPKALGAAWALGRVVGAGYENEMVTITFADGSTGGLQGGRDARELAEAVKRRVTPG